MFLQYTRIILSFLCIIFCSNPIAYARDILGERDLLPKQNNPSLKEGFVYLDMIDPSIIVDLKYSHENNFKKDSLIGIKNNRAILTLDAALALSSAQEDLKLRGYSLVVYNAYIPKRAYLEMLEITENDMVDSTSHPNLASLEIIKAGYLRDKLDNIRGSSVDVSIIPLNKKLRDFPNVTYRNHNNNTHIKYEDDGSEDMGTSYDTFDELSCHKCKNIRVEAQVNRELLKTIMEENGFKASELVWWKYTYMRQPYPDSQFDFEI